MSLISKALKKVQDSRVKLQKDESKNIVYLTDAPQSWPRTALMALWIVSTLAAIVVSIAAIQMGMKNSDLKQMQLLALERASNNQEKRINEFINAINKNQKFTDGQIHDLNFRLNEEGQDIKTDINNLTVTDNDHYSNLKDALVNDKEDISALDKYTKDLNQKIEKIAAEETQAKDLTIPANGN